MAISIQTSWPQRVKYNPEKPITTARMRRLMLRERTMDLRSRSLACCSSAMRRESKSRGSPATPATMTTNQIYKWPNLAKDFFHFLKQAARLRLVLDGGCSGQLGQQFALTLVEPGGRLESYLDMKIAFATSPDGRQPFPAHPQDCS